MFIDWDGLKRSLQETSDKAKEQAVARCKVCKRKENPYQDADYVCWECRTVGQTSKGPTNSNNDEAPNTWPKHWRVSTLSNKQVYCLKHNTYFPVKKVCERCKKEGIV